LRALIFDEKINNSLPTAKISLKLLTAFVAIQSVREVFTTAIGAKF